MLRFSIRMRRIERELERTDVGGAGRCITYLNHRTMNRNRSTDSAVGRQFVSAFLSELCLL